MTVEKLSLKDQVAIVTGGGRGIGRAIVRTLAEAGADVVVTARTVPEIESAAAEVRAMGRRALAVAADVRFPDQIQALVQRAVAEFGRIDILVNNAGGSRPRPSLDVSERAWTTIITENLTTVFLCSQAVAKVMVGQKRGSIVNIASQAGRGPSPGMAAYGASKAGIINLTQTLAVEWAPYGIRVNCVAPGLVLTPAAIDALLPMAGLKEEAESRVPLGRLGQPEDIAPAVLYLASEAASWVTGQTIDVNGGPVRAELGFTG